MPAGGERSSKWGPGHWPTEVECVLLLERTGCSARVVEHLVMAARIAVAIANRINANCEGAVGLDERKRAGGVKVDVNLVRAGALLHDIGRSRTHGIMHAVVGAEMARQLGLSEELALIIERHIGAGIELEEAAKLGLPPRDYLPVTLEEKIVAHADNLAGRDGKLKLAGVLHDLELKGAAHVVPRMEELHRDLSKLCGVDIDEIVVP